MKTHPTACEALLTELNDPEWNILFVHCVCVINLLAFSCILTGGICAHGV